ncbi:UDP-2,3-diacylglucosamine diphosphatase [Hahella sp. NBU794]|uniref:UDP-2,3-diacylglucosamine diphosphatase n=1 Tax=Hahella sp. NBU794 TaxID=3422590 RepID=UPI003D6EE652
MPTLFISDLHLEVEKPELTRFFFNFLDKIAPNADALYILGDFFEVWVGDDEQTALQVEVAQRLHRLAEAGTCIYLMHGNRDFLIGDTYAKQCGATLLEEPHSLDLYGVPSLLMHGDSLCTLDAAYQKARATFRNPAFQSQFLSRPLDQRQLTARQMRQISMAKNQGKAEEIMDVAPDEVISAFNTYKIELLIHGHTHRPDTHRYNLPQGEVKRIVLGDWGDETWYGRADADGFQLLNLKAEDIA